MRENNTKFNKTWQKKRTDFPKGDYSQSSYDLSLIMQCLSAKLSVQEIADVICTYRKQYGRETRLAYLRWTLQTALMRCEERAGHDPKTIGDLEASFADNQREEELLQSQRDTKDQKKAQEEAQQEGYQENPERYREAQLELLRDIEQFFEFPEDLHIESVTYIVCDNSHYQFTLKNGHGVHRQVSLYARKSRLRDISLLFTEYTRRQINANPKLAGPVWKELFNRLATLVPEEEEPELCTENEVYSSLCHYLDGHALPKPEFEGSPSQAYREALSSKYPIMKDGAIHISLVDFRAWAKRDHALFSGDKAAPLALLKRMGAETITVAIRTKNGTDTEVKGQRYWRLPIDPRMHNFVDMPTPK